MRTDEEIKELVKDKYGKIAFQTLTVNKNSCCGSGPNVTFGYSVMSDDYSKVEGYNPDADLGLGCGLPTEFADMKSGDTILDLGAGAGNDAFIARRIVGEKGKVIGLDMTPEMIVKANENLKKSGYDNVEFRFGEIEDMPVDDNSVDVVISNCVLNLVPDKEKAFSEIYRVLKPNGHFCISDIVLTGEIPDKIRDAATMYAGCVSGALLKSDYIGTIEKSGFRNIQIQKEKIIDIPYEILKEYLNNEEILQYKGLENIIVSITVTGDK